MTKGSTVTGQSYLTLDQLYLKPPTLFRDDPKKFRLGFPFLCFYGLNFK
ncbi:hypothetical protein DERF_002025 [Dermatophagoides farinae]|uniref:Uncharacterized protein n=1 Tax=Dermatophagoides farinae TaxID=6954 RepID=A0A922ICY2_DERFA|nr:hypothetical protein DERF_002025 [Dermatophagoides farinae]